MTTVRGQGWMWARAVKALDPLLAAADLRETAAQREPCRGETAAGTLLRMRQRAIPALSCAREPDQVGA